MVSVDCEGRRMCVLAGLLLLCAAAAGAASARERVPGAEGVVTPHPHVGNYKYIPLGSNVEDDFGEVITPTAQATRPHLAPSELIMTVLRTALDIVRNINKNRAKPTTGSTDNYSSKRKTLRIGGAVKQNVTDKLIAQAGARGRGYDYYDEHHDPTTTSTAKPAKPRYTDPWAGYYDFLINEGSFKFWSIFQLFTAGLLLYACLSAIYYAKFNPIIPDYDREYDDYFLERSAGRQARSLDASILPSGLSWIGPQTFQFIMDSIAKKYENKE